MKNLLLFIFCCFSFWGFSQVHSAMPPEAKSFYQNAMRSINPEIKHIVENNAGKLKGRNVNTDSLSIELKKNPLLKKCNQREIQAITVLIMVRASKNADEYLKKLVMNMRKDDDGNSSAFDVTKPILEHKSRIAENINIAMKKMGASQENVIKNLE